MYLYIFFGDTIESESAFVCCVAMKNMRYVNSQLELIEDKGGDLR